MKKLLALLLLFGSASVVLAGPGLPAPVVPPMHCQPGKDCSPQPCIDNICSAYVTK